MITPPQKQAELKQMIHKLIMKQDLTKSVLLAGGEYFSVGYEVEEKMEDDINIEITRPMAEFRNHKDCFTLHLPDPADVAFSGNDEQRDSRYQLSLRVDDSTYRYLTNLAHRAEAETISELVRMSLRALEDALHEYKRIERSDGLVVEIGQPAKFDRDGNLATLRASPTRRINVVLREAAHQRLNRLMSKVKGLTLVDLVMTAVGVVDANLNSGTSYEKNEKPPLKKGGRLQKKGQGRKETEDHEKEVA